MAHIYVIDDDAAMRSLLEDFLRGRGHQVSTFPLATKALSALQNPKIPVDLIISDVKMPEMDGLTFVKELQQKDNATPVILITAFGSIESAIEAIRAGAYDYVVKPFKLAEIQVTVDRAIEYLKLRQDNKVLRKAVRNEWKMGAVIGKSPQMKTVFDLVDRVKNATANVLITGESGTGKEIVARAIHESGPRKGNAFVAINCTAIPETLLESELFGYAKGSFTGANRDKKGLFEEANHGTLFLDEIGDMDLSLQAKLLRVLQEKKIRPVGENTAKEVDVRIIAATHKDLKTAIREERFREDLYYRLSVIPIHIPALRHRKEDIPLLADYFLKKYSASNDVHIEGFTPEANQKLLNQRWEGNVRELENLIERTVVLCNGNRIEASDIPTSAESTVEDFFGQSTRDLPTLEELSNRYIDYILDRTGGMKTKAAQILGINRRTLYRKGKEKEIPVSK